MIPLLIWVHLFKIFASTPSLNPNEDRHGNCVLFAWCYVRLNSTAEAFDKNEDKWPIESQDEEAIQKKEFPGDEG